MALLLLLLPLLLLLYQRHRYRLEVPPSGRNFKRPRQMTSLQSSRGCAAKQAYLVDGLVHTHATAL